MSRLGARTGSQLAIREAQQSDSIFYSISDFGQYFYYFPINDGSYTWIKKISSHAIFNPITGVITVPRTGVYDITYSANVTLYNVTPYEYMLVRIYDNTLGGILKLIDFTPMPIGGNISVGNLYFNQVMTLEAGHEYSIQMNLYRLKIDATSSIQIYNNVLKIFSLENF